MPFWLDEFIVFRSAVFARGWSSDRPIRLLLDGKDCGAEMTGERRPDLVPHYGMASEKWGFQLRSFVDRPDAHRGLSLKFGGEVVQSERCIPPHDQQTTALFWTFIAELNAARARVLEIGSRARSGIERRTLLPQCTYVGFDVLPGPNVDVVGDAHYLAKYFGEEFDAVISMSTFEHLLMPWKVAAEINGVLKHGGRVFTQSHQTWPLHDAPWDFFRFSQDAWRGLFNRATGFTIIRAEHAEQAVSTPRLQLSSNDVTRLDGQSGYLNSLCIAQKTGRPLVDYRVDRSIFNDILGTMPYPG